MEKKIILNEERYDKLLNNCIDYLIMLWGINNKDMVNKYFKEILGFTDEELDYFGIKEHI